jgi:hypothetical protein
MMPRRRGYRLHPLFDSNNEPCTVADLLTPEERMQRRYGIPPARERVAGDPALVAVVARLQGGSHGA